MIFKKNIFGLLLLTCFNVIVASSLSALDLQVGKDLVLSNEKRDQVLLSAGKIFSRSRTVLVDSSVELVTPFSFRKAEEIAEVEEVIKEKPVEIVYSDTAILSAVAKNLSNQIQGTLARGKTRFLQFNGGALVRPGTEFPASIPQLKGQTFNITVTTIESNGYTLLLNDSELFVPFVDAASASRAKLYEDDANDKAVEEETE